MKKEEVKVEYYDNGNKYSETHYKDGELDGVYAEWYEEGIMMSETHYKDGKPDGVCTEWCQDGTKIEEHYKDGKKEGVETKWYEDETMMSETHYKNDELDGVSTWWYKGGTKNSEAHYKDGKKDGVWTTWHENGTKRSEQNIKDENDPNSVFNEWDFEGTKIAAPPNRTETFNFTDNKGDIKITLKRYYYDGCYDGDSNEDYRRISDFYIIRWNINADINDFPNEYEDVDDPGFLDEFLCLVEDKYNLSFQDSIWGINNTGFFGEKSERFYKDGKWHWS